MHVGRCLKITFVSDIYYAKCMTEKFNTIDYTHGNYKLTSGFKLFWSSTCKCSATNDYMYKYIYQITSSLQNTSHNIPNSSIAITRKISTHCFTVYYSLPLKLGQHYPLAKQPLAKNGVIWLINLGSNQPNFKIYSSSINIIQPSFKNSCIIRGKYILAKQV